MLYPDINSRKRTQQNSTRYRTALYLRLSREDGDKTESDSIANQRTLLEAYTADHPELCIVDEFVDDGYSGSNFERPAFQTLFKELEQGTVNCILVKDLSRFGRNYIEAGDVMHLSQNVVETFIDRIEVFNDESVKIRFTFEDVLKSYEAE